MNILNKLSPQFKQFLQEEGIDEEIFLFEQTLRYVRIKPDYQITFEQLKQQVSFSMQPIHEIPKLYSLPADQKINNLQLYKDGHLYGIDKSSAAVVYSLDINKDDINVLEICCAPGAKLTFIADLLRVETEKDGIQRKVFGVDISQNRLNITQSIVNKYKLEKYVELILQDGTKYKNQIQFDKVLIDAECTHEGSIKHLKKYIQKPMHEQNSKKQQKNNKASKKQLQKNYTNTYTTEQTKANEWTEEDFNSRFLDQKKLQQIYDLQFSLLENGYKLLKQNGILIYSTCSFSQKQNEDQIIKFLEQNYDAILVHPFYGMQEQQCKSGQIFNTVRFDPKVSNTGGMFIAKIKKL
ncbi:unnamed protein product [Paramecium primaurelia]|uniref:SAM-dependent MTase RsmB/NOP-type domain-containing protein n=1 Tax=Paramecium primaurelia TaxID=5886 RepID=A0A8S1Q7X4_PARPR|nr:unnamed protein product [Paramecium primaurelia]